MEKDNIKCIETSPLLSIACIAYNHVQFISEAIESFLMQETSFTFEIVIHDDCSTDGTIEIIKTYAKKYPNLIRPIYQTTNQYSSGKRILPIIVPLCRGKYIAICEGDDYWIEPLKLQKQVDFLEAHPDYSICFHRVFEQKGNKLILSKLNPENENIYSILDLATGNLIHTPSVLFRNHLFERFPEWFNRVPAGDYALHMLNAKYGLIKYFPEPMAVYRIHGSSLWSSQNRVIILERWLKVLNLLLDEDFDLAVLEVIKGKKRKYINELLFIYLESNMSIFIEQLKKFSEEDPDVGFDWLFNQYPKYIQNYKTSNTYKVLKKIGTIKDRILNT